MSYAAAFLAAIQEAPDDDAPRLIYADWLDEQGEPDRAEFVRAQCAIARMDEDDPAQPALEVREQALWKKHGKAWRQPLAPFSRKFAFARGFPEEVLVPARTFVDRAAEVFAAAPLFAVRLRGAKSCIEEVAACPYLERLTSFSLYYNNIGQGRAQVFFRSAYLGRLTSLNMKTNAIRAGGVRALLGARLGRLTALDLEDNEVGDAGVEALVGSEMLGRLTALNLARNGLTPAGVEALARCPAAARLTDLNLGGNDEVGDEAVGPLVTSPHLGAVRRLDWWCRAAADIRRPGRSNGLTRAGAAALAASGLFRGLTALGLAFNQNLRDAGLAALAAAGGGALAELDVSHCRIGNEGMKALAGSSLLTGLRELRLNCNGFTAVGAAALAYSPHARSLRALHLPGVRLGDAGARALAMSPHLGGLRELDLCECALTSDAAAVIAASPGLAGLRRLDLSGNALRDEGARALARSPYLTRLRELVVLNTAVHKASLIGRPGWSELFARFGAAVIPKGRP